jgi:hypothetical protein
MYDDEDDESLTQWPIYQAALQRGILRGRLQMLESQLTHRFGSLPEAAQTILNSLDREGQSQLARASFDFKSMEDVSTWLEQHQSQNGAA